jgi:GT2 family glycosyltransferase
LRAGDGVGAARTFLQALGHDPWHGAARAEAHFAASQLGQAGEARGPIPAQVAPASADGPVAVSIVIPVYGKLDLTRQCLDAIDATCAGVPHEVIVVDNASPDGTADFLRAAEAEGRLRAILNEENLGFGKACNAGAAIARGDHVLLLNNDTIPHPGWLEALLAGLDDPTVGLVGARLLYADGTIQHAGVNFTPSLMTQHVHRGVAADDPAVLEARDYPAVTGACMLLSKRLWDDIGGLDEGYRHYVEDVDLCMHVWERGLRVRYVPESVVTHLEQQSAPDRAWIDALVEEGWRRFYRVWSSRWPQAVRDLSPVELPEGTRSFAVVALARDLIERPGLISAYAAAFSPEDDATLVVYDEERDSNELAVALGPTLAAAGLDESGPDMLAFGRRVDGDVLLSLTTHALLGDSEPHGALRRLPRFGSSQLEALRAAAEASWDVAA